MVVWVGSGQESKSKIGCQFWGSWKTLNLFETLIQFRWPMPGLLVNEEIEGNQCLPFHEG